jgi:hypothetical protein
MVMKRANDRVSDSAAGCYSVVVVCQNLIHAGVSGKFRRDRSIRVVEYERRFGGLAMTQVDRLYRGADGVAKPGRLLADLIA